MPRFKTLLVSILALTLIFLLAGCQDLFSPTAEPEEEVVNGEGELPAWLLADHRTNGGPREVEDEEEMLKEPEEDEEADETVTEPAPEEVQPVPAEEPAPEPAEGDHVVEGEVDGEQLGDEPEPDQEIIDVTNESFQRGSYTGKWDATDGVPHGYGTWARDGGELTGEWVEGNPHGQFTVTHPDGTTEQVRFDRGTPVEDETGDWFDLEGSQDSDWFN